jgi:ribosome biogenesis protein UTP30
LQANVEAVVNGLIEKFVPQQWRNVRAVHIKGPNTAALPIWLTEELWAEETQVLEQQEQSALTDGKKRKRGALVAEEEGVIEVPGADGKMRRLEKPSKQRKSNEASVEETKKSAAEAEAKATEKIEKAARKEAIKAQKLAAKNEATVAVKKAASKAKPRMKAADLN